MPDWHLKLGWCKVDKLIKAPSGRLILAVGFIPRIEAASPFIRRVCDGAICCIIDPGRDIRGMNSPSTVIPSPRDGNVLEGGLGKKWFAFSKMDVSTIEILQRVKIRMGGWLRSGRLDGWGCRCVQQEMVDLGLNMMSPEFFRILTLDGLPLAA
jgi:hypothetical protein